MAIEQVDRTVVTEGPAARGSGRVRDRPTVQTDRRRTTDRAPGPPRWPAASSSSSSG